MARERTEIPNLEFQTSFLEKKKNRELPYNSKKTSQRSAPYEKKRYKG